MTCWMRENKNCKKNVCNNVRKIRNDQIVKHEPKKYETMQTVV